MGELRLLCMSGGLSVLLTEDTEDVGSDLVVDDGLVVFTNNVDGTSGGEGQGLSKCGALTDRPVCQWELR